MRKQERERDNRGKSKIDILDVRIFAGFLAVLLAASYLEGDAQSVAPALWVMMAFWLPVKALVSRDKVYYLLLGLQTGVFLYAGLWPLGLLPVGIIGIVIFVQFLQGLMK